MCVRVNACVQEMHVRACVFECMYLNGLGFWYGSKHARTNASDVHCKLWACARRTRALRSCGLEARCLVHDALDSSQGLRPRLSVRRRRRRLCSAAVCRGRAIMARGVHAVRTEQRPELKGQPLQVVEVPARLGELGPRHAGRSSGLWRFNCWLVSPAASRVTGQRHARTLRVQAAVCQPPSALPRVPRPPYHSSGLRSRLMPTGRRRSILYEAFKAFPSV